MPALIGWGSLVAGLASLALYVRHAGRVDNPILDLRVLKVSTLRASVSAGTLFRSGLGALPFLVPLTLQEGFGYSPAQSGMISFASALGAIGSRGFTSSILKRFGFRKALLILIPISSAFIAAYALFGPSTPIPVIFVLLAAGGVFRSVGYASFNALSFADVESSQLSAATSISFMAQRLAMAIGVAIAAALLHLFSGMSPQLTTAAFSWTYVAIAVISILALPIVLKMPADAGAELSGQRRTAE
jgi:MFS family permease